MKLAVVALLLALSSAGVPAGRNLASVITNRAIFAPHRSVLANHPSYITFVLQPALSSTDPRSAASAHLALGFVRERAGAHEQALEEWRRANAQPVWEHLARLAVGRRDLTGSIELYQRAIALGPSKLDNYFSLAWIYWPGLGRVQDALEMYGRAATIARVDSAERAMAEGYVFRLRLDWPEALRSFERATAADSKNADAHRQAALAAVELREFPIAIAHLKDAIAATPEDSAIYIELGDVYRTSGQGDAAAAYGQALQVNPDNGAARQRLALMATRP